MRRTLWLVCGLAACSGAPDDPTAGDTDLPTDPSDPSDPSDPTDPTTPPTTPDFAVADVSWRLHDDIESLVYLDWTQSGAGNIRVEYSFEADSWLSSPTVSRSAGPQEQLLLGIPFAQTVQWRILAGETVVAEGADVETGPSPARMPVASLEIARPDQWFADGNYLLTSVNESEGGWTGGPFWTVILDRAGRAVWARPTPNDAWTLFAQVSTHDPDHLLLDQDSVWSEFDDGEASRVDHLYLDAEISSIPTQGLQHAFVEHPDGTLAWGSLYHADVEALMELAPGAADPTIIWTCHDWPGSGDCESNGLFYDPPSDTYLYSFWTNHSVVAVDRAGTSLWWAGTVSDGYDFVPQGSQFWLQHGVSYTDQGTLLLSSEEDGPTTMVREFAIDHAAHTLSLVWSFDSEVHAVTNGDAWRLANGNTLHVVGSAGVIDEATPDGTVVWQVDYHSERLLGRGTLLDDLYRYVSP